MMNRVSKVFQPALIVPKNATIKHREATSKSQRVRESRLQRTKVSKTSLIVLPPPVRSVQLMLEQGLMRQAGNGTIHLLPVLQRAVQKAIDLIDRHMQSVDAQRITLPVLTPAELWRQSGRLSESNPQTELLQTKDRHGKVQILGPVRATLALACAAYIDD